MDFIFERKINYYETDKMGIVHHSNYIRFLEEARCKMLEQFEMPYSSFESNGIMIPVLGVNCSFKHHVTFNDIILIEPYVKQFNGVRLTMGYSITNKKTGNIVLTGETKHCFTDTSLKPIRLQNHIPEFYDKFINSLDSLVFGKKEAKIGAIKFLLKVGLGWAIGMMIAVLVLTNLFETHIYEVSSVFIGFIIFSIPFIIKEEKKALKGKYINLIYLLAGIAVVALITYFNPVSGGDSVNIATLNFELGAYIFVAAMVAISAMVLPGISGSTLLLIFGLYIPIISAIKEVLHFNFTFLPALIIFGFGILAGITAIIKGIKVALEKHRSPTMYLILGLMIGSIYAIVMGPTTLETPEAPMTFQTFSIIYFLVGGVIIYGLEKLKMVLEKKANK